MFKSKSTKPVLLSIFASTYRLFGYFTGSSHVTEEKLKIMHNKAELLRLCCPCKIMRKVCKLHNRTILRGLI